MFLQPVEGGCIACHFEESDRGLAVARTLDRDVRRLDATIVEATGQVDYVNTSIGVATASLFMIEASMHIPPGYAMFIPSAFRKAIDLPVVGVGRFKDPLQAERALAEAKAEAERLAEEEAETD